jgi:hypothetical protein
MKKVINENNTINVPILSKTQPNPSQKYGIKILLSEVDSNIKPFVDINKEPISSTIPNTSTQHIHMKETRDDGIKNDPRSPLYLNKRGSISCEMEKEETLNDARKIIVQAKENYEQTNNIINSYIKKENKDLPGKRNPEERHSGAGREEPTSQEIGKICLENLNVERIESKNENSQPMIHVKDDKNNIIPVNIEHMKIKKIDNKLDENDNLHIKNNSTNIEKMDKKDNLLKNPTKQEEKKDDIIQPGFPHNAGDHIHSPREDRKEQIVKEDKKENKKEEKEGKRDKKEENKKEENKKEENKKEEERKMEVATEESDVKIWPKLTADDLNVSFKVIGILEEGNRLKIIDNKYLDIEDSYFTSISRKQSRKTILSFMEHLITQTEEIMYFLLNEIKTNNDIDNNISLLNTIYHNLTIALHNFDAARFVYKPDSSVYAKFGVVRDNFFTLKNTFFRRVLLGH